MGRRRWEWRNGFDRHLGLTSFDVILATAMVLGVLLAIGLYVRLFVSPRPGVLEWTLPIGLTIVLAAAFWLLYGPIRVSVGRKDRAEH